MPEPNISTCQDVVRWWRSLVVFVAGVRIVEFGSKTTFIVHTRFNPAHRTITVPSRKTTNLLRCI